MLGSLIGGAVNLVSGLFGYNSQKKTNSANAQLTREQMAWETQMSNTAHQREIADLKKAGLNPALSGTGGSGASTPVGASATMENPMNSAMQIYNTLLQQKQIKANIKNQNEITKSQVQLNEANAELAREQAQYTGYFPTSTSANGNLLGFGGGYSETKYIKGGTPAKQNNKIELLKKQTKNSSAYKLANWLAGKM